MSRKLTFTVYRLNDAHGIALYVGATTNITARLHNHRVKSWWPNVHRCELAFFDTRAEMLRFETATIRECSPKHNVLDNEFGPGRWRRGERRNRVLSLLNAGPATTAELRLILGNDFNVGADCHALKVRGHIKPVGWSKAKCPGGYAAVWAPADSDFPEVPRPTLPTSKEQQ